MHARAVLPGRLAAQCGLVLVLLSSTALCDEQVPSRRQAARSPAPEQVAAMAAERALAEGRSDAALAAARALGESHPLTLTVRGRLALVEGDYAQAEALFKQAASSDQAGDAALELGLLLMRLGRSKEALPLLTVVSAAGGSAESGQELARVGRASRALGNFRQANGYFRAAAAAAPDDPAVHTAWGDLFLEKYNRPEARRSYEKALSLAPSWAPAHLGLARTLSQDNPPAAEASARRALAIDGRLEGAYLLLAELELDAGHRAEAKSHIDKALSVNGKSPDALAMKSAVAWLEGRTDDHRAALQAALAINPSYGEAYRIVGDQAARAYRFDEAVALIKQGLALDAGNSRAQGSLGAHLLRTGDETGARTALEQAFRADPYDAVTYNLLSLLDTLDKFHTFEEQGLVVRLDPDEAAVLKHYAVPLASQAITSLSKKYAFQPKGPILVEIFPRHDDFAVRTVGLPGMIGALGACFGRVVTMDSPRAREPGSFNWRATLWHELAHVITLQLSAQRVPRWLTEGISVSEERAAEPAWGRESELKFLQALETGDEIKLADLPAAFSNPQLITLAYFQASLVVDHLVERFGANRLRALLVAYASAVDTETVMREALGVDLAGLQTGFDAFVEKRYGSVRAALRRPADAPETLQGLDTAALLALAQKYQTSAYVLGGVGQALIEAGALDEARAPLERAAELAPVLTGAGSPRALLADLAEKQGDPERAMGQLELALRQDATGLALARKLGDLARKANDARRLHLAADRIIDLDPFDASPHAVLGRAALARGDTAMAIREFTVALEAGPADAAGAHSDLAETHLAAGNLAEAKREAIAALEIAPRYERAQELLLSVVERKK